MDNTGALFSVLVGLLCAGAGILALPKSGSEAGPGRAVLTAVAAAVPVLGWILWLGHPLAAGLAFVVGTLIAGQLRDRARGHSARGRGEAAVAGGAAVESGAVTVSLPEPRQDTDGDVSAGQSGLARFTEIGLSSKIHTPQASADLAASADTAEAADPAEGADPTAPIDPAEPGELATVAP
jgi:hypothetical protein